MCENNNIFNIRDTYDLKIQGIPRFRMWLIHELTKYALKKHLSLPFIV